MHVCLSLYATMHTSHTSLMERWEGKQRRVNRCSMLQQQLHAFQASSCTGIAQRSAAVNVACIHLEDREPWLRQKKPILVTPSWWASNSNTRSPEHQHPAVVWHTGSVPVYTPRGGGWWSRRPRCSLPRLPRSAAAAGGPCPVPPPRALLTGRSRIRDHELQICKSKQQ